MNYSQNDIENVLEYWQDISQDVKYISDELNLDINNVIDILSKLQSENQINGFEKIQKRKRQLDLARVKKGLSPTGLARDDLHVLQHNGKSGQPAIFQWNEGLAPRDLSRGMDLRGCRAKFRVYKLGIDQTSNKESQDERN